MPRPSRRQPRQRLVGLSRLVGAAVVALGVSASTFSATALPADAAPPPVAHAPAVGMAATPSGDGYWQATGNGGVYSFGGAQFYGAPSAAPNAPMRGITSTPTGRGYWLVGADGGVFSYGDARFFGSMGGKPLNSPIVGMSGTKTGKGYWLVGADGGVFSYGDARFFGSMGSKPLNKPIVGMAATPSGGGYWLVGADGGIFSYGDAAYRGRVVYTEPGTPAPGDLFADSSRVSCAAGTIDAGTADGYHKGTRVPIRLCEIPAMASTSREARNGHAVVNSRVSGQVNAMVNAARAAGVTLKATSTFRSMSHQQQLCRDNPGCARGDYAYVAKPGYSNHQMGLAIDFSGPKAKGGKSCARRATAPRSATWNWLKQNADAFGFHQYSAESWHWDVLSGGNRC